MALSMSSCVEEVCLGIRVPVHHDVHRFLALSLIQVLQALSDQRVVEVLVALTWLPEHKPPILRDEIERSKFPDLNLFKVTSAISSR
jgi:hypothetical protein